MEVIEKYPITLAERLELGAGEVRLPGSFDDFMEMIEVCDYPIEYINNEIIIMSIASDPHEKIVANLLRELGIIFKRNPDFHRYGSNRHVCVPDVPGAYSPDASIVKGQPEIFTYAPGKTANLNPWLVAEIISKSSRGTDLGEKLPDYKTIPSLRYILYFEQDKPLLTLHHRASETSRWTSEDFDSLDQTFEIEGKPILMADVYENVLL